MSFPGFTSLIPQSWLSRGYDRTGDALDCLFKWWDRVFLALQVVLVDEEALLWGLPRVLSESWL